MGTIEQIHCLAGSAGWLEPPAGTGAWRGAWLSLRGSRSLFR